MRVVVIGATGHVGGYLVPRLVAAGHDVVAISRGVRRPYREHPAWSQVHRVEADRHAEDAAGTFAARVAELRPDAVIDMVCFTPESASQLVEVLRGTDTLLLHCGTIWVHGTAVEVPLSEDAVRRPFGEYGIKKAAIEDLLHAAWKRDGVRSVVLHPGHISGPGWDVVNPAANFDPAVWETLAAGEELLLPNFGLETVHHVHPDDVAQAFELALGEPAAVGESFHVVSERALTLRGFAEAAAGWFGRTAQLTFAPFETFRAAVAEQHAAATLDHISRSPSVSIAKARRMLGYAPRYTSLAATAEAVHWLSANGRLDLGGAALQLPTSG